MPAETSHDVLMTQQMVLGTQISVLGLAAVHVGFDWFAFALLALGFVATVGAFVE